MLNRTQNICHSDSKDNEFVKAIQGVFGFIGCPVEGVNDILLDALNQLKMLYLQKSYCKQNEKVASFAASRKTLRLIGDSIIVIRNSFIHDTVS